MLLETISNQSDSSEPLTHIPCNWYVYLKFLFAQQGTHFPQGEFVHRIVKCLFILTNKKDVVTQIVTKYHCEAHLSEVGASKVGCRLDAEELEVAAPELHHHISHS